MKNLDIFDRVRGGLIVSCQALEKEPLHSSFIMSRMAVAAEMSGAVGIRANTVADITEIRKMVRLPMIGIIKQIYKDSDVYITPTMVEVDALVETGVEIIAMDATNRLRTGGKSLDDIFHEVRNKYPDQLFMQIVPVMRSAARRGDRLRLRGTTMAGYTPYTQGTSCLILPSSKRFPKRSMYPLSRRAVSTTHSSCGRRLTRGLSAPWSAEQSPGRRRLPNALWRFYEQL